MPKKFTRIIILMLVLSAPVFFAGCTKKCPKPDENVPGTSTFRSDCPVAGDPSADPNARKEINFYFIHDNTDAFQEQIQAFQSSNPGVLVRPKKFVNLQEYEELIINEIAEGEGPDVFMVHNSWIPKHYKKLRPLSLDQPVVINPELFRQVFFQAAADDLIIDEQIYGAPLAIDNLAVYYNKAFFKDLIATSDKPGQLWENIKEQTFQLTKRNNSPERFALAGIALGRSDNISSAIDILYAMMLQYGVKFYDDKEESATFANDTGAGLNGVKNPGLAAFELFTSFALPSYKNYSWNEYITGFAPQEKEVNPFVRGKVAMIIGYPYLYDYLSQSIQNQQKLGNKHIDLKDIGIAPFPQLVSGQEATQRDTYASYFPLVVARTTDVPQEAWSFIQFLTSADALQTYHKKTNRPTSRKDMVSDQQTEALFGVFAYQAPFSKSYRIYDDTAYRKVFSAAIESVISNVASPKEALQAAEDKITCILRKQKGLIEAGIDCGI